MYFFFICVPGSADGRHFRSRHRQAARLENQRAPRMTGNEAMSQKPNVLKISWPFFLRVKYPVTNVVMKSEYRRHCWALVVCVFITHKQTLPQHESGPCLRPRPSSHPPVLKQTAGRTDEVLMGFRGSSLLITATPHRHGCVTKCRSKCKLDVSLIIICLFPLWATGLKKKAFWL